MHIYFFLSIFNTQGVCNFSSLVVSNQTNLTKERKKSREEAVRDLLATDKASEFLCCWLELTAVLHAASVTC